MRMSSRTVLSSPANSKSFVDEHRRTATVGSGRCSGPLTGSKGELPSVSGDNMLPKVKFDSCQISEWGGFFFLGI